MANLETYVRRSGTIGNEGFDYEKHLCMRLLQYIEQNDKDFSLANNMDGIGNFDDIVCFSQNKPLFVFIQAKHTTSDKQVIARSESQHTTEKKKNEDQLIAENFIPKLYESFKTIKDNFFPKFGIQFSECDCEFIYFTNRGFSTEVIKSLELMTGEKCSSEVLKSIMSENLYKIPKFPKIPESLENPFHLALLKGIENEERKNKEPKNKRPNIEELKNKELEDEVFMFCEMFRFCIKQKSAKEVRKFVVQEQKSGDKNERIISRVEKYMDQWCSKIGDVDYLSIHHRLIAKCELLTFKEDCLTFLNDKCHLHADVNLTFDSEYFSQLITSKQIISLTFTDSNLLVYSKLVIDLVKEFYKKEIEEDELLVVDSGVSVNSLESAYHLFKVIFIIARDNTPNVDKVYKVVEKFFRETEGSVFILHNKDCIPEIKTEKNNFVFGQLTNDSRTFFLEQKLIFQGIDSKICEVFSDKTELINAEIVSRLAQNKDVFIGKELPDMGVVSAYYMPRYFISSCVDYFLFLLRENRNNDFYILFKTGEVNYSPDLMDESICKIVKKQNSLIDNFGLTVKKQNVHKFEIHDLSIRYIETKGSRTELDKFMKFNNDNDLMISQDFLKEKCINSLPGHRNIIISDIPGNGKSTSLIYLSRELKKKYVDKFIVIINLNSVKGQLVPDKKYNKNDSIKFLADHVMKDNTSEDTFSYLCDTPNRVIVLIDAFDEIAPNFETTIKSFLEALKETKIQNIIITTRPHCLEILENVLEVTKVIHMAKFDQKIQQTFLHKIWIHKIGSDNCSEEIVGASAKNLIEFIHSRNEADFKNITGIPLLLEIMSEVHLTEVKDCIKTGKKFVTEYPTYSFLSLYEKYFDEKLKILLAKKFKITDPIQIETLDTAMRKTAIKTHTSLALKEIFDDTIIATYFKIKNDDKVKKPDDLVLRLGIVVKHNNKYTFMHRTFAEYFCGLKFSKIYPGGTDKDRKFMYENVLSPAKYGVIRRFLEDAMERVENLKK